MGTRDLRALMLFLYCTLFQIAIIFQLPFLHVRFIVNFYVCVILFFSHHLIAYLQKTHLQKNKSSVFSYGFDILVLFYLMSQHTVLSSFNLILILLFLFLAGMDLGKTQNILLTGFCSLMLSIINLIFIKWEGIQNLFSLVLFNFSFIVVSVIAQQFKMQFFELKSEIVNVTKKLRTQEEFAHVLIEHMPTGLTAFNSRGDVLFINKNLEAKLKLSASDLYNIYDQSHMKNDNEIHFFNPQLQEKKIYDVNLGYYQDQLLNDRVDLMMVEDVTEVKHLQDQMRQREKLAAIGQLAAGIAHEIRNPLAGISGSIELLSHETQNPDDKKLMKIILREIDRLNNLITEFLDYSKPTVRPDQKIDLSLVLDEVVQNVKLSLQNPADLELTVKLVPAFILGFSDKLKQAFLNITMNAVQAMNDTERTKKLNVNLEIIESEVVVRIEDTGKGMSEETKKRIFEPFFTTKAKGTGLGLAVTHKILEAHDVKMQIESEINKGTTFILKFKKV